MWSRLKQLFNPHNPEVQPASGNFLPGDRTCRLQVVGEASYQQNLEALCGGRSSEVRTSSRLRC
ncbi:MAG: hypothetical protein ACRERX_16295 [Pseudomonas sp.]